MVLREIVWIKTKQKSDSLNQTTFKLQKNTSQKLISAIKMLLSKIDVHQMKDTEIVWWTMSA